MLNITSNITGSKEEGSGHTWRENEIGYMTTQSGQASHISRWFHTISTNWTPCLAKVLRQLHGTRTLRLTTTATSERPNTWRVKHWQRLHSVRQWNVKYWCMADKIGHRLNPKSERFERRILTIHRPTQDCRRLVKKTQPQSVGLLAFGDEDIVGWIRLTRLRCAGHVIRMEDPAEDAGRKTRKPDWLPMLRLDCGGLRHQTTGTPSMTGDLDHNRWRKHLLEPMTSHGFSSANDDKENRRYNA